MRGVALLLIAPFLTLASSFAPQHIHEGAAHEHAIAHSHFAPHELSSHHDHGTEIERDDDHVVWLDSAIDVVAPFQAAPVLAESAVTAEFVVPTATWSVTPFDDSAPLHGPPKRSHLFRGPPLPPPELI